MDQKVIGCAIEVHKELGPGFLEGIYRNAMLMGLRARRLRCDAEKEISVHIVERKSASIG